MTGGCFASSRTGSSHVGRLRRIAGNAEPVMPGQSGSPSGVCVQTKFKFHAREAQPCRPNSRTRVSSSRESERLVRFCSQASTRYGHGTHEDPLRSVLLVQALPIPISARSRQTASRRGCYRSCRKSDRDSDWSAIMYVVCLEPASH
jgi:hypothetical protein